MIEQNENWSLLGASRGLGLEFSKLVPQLNKDISLFLASRTINHFDFSNEDLFEFYCEEILNTKPQRIFYFAAGGSYGPFGKFDWKDHKWTMNVSFNFPAFLLNYFLKNHQGVKQIIFIGSKIAENDPDPNAAMYCAAKHALKGLVSSVQLENPPFELTLYSPGYMDTGLLPKGAWPRSKGIVSEPSHIAKSLMQLVM
ncbi:MAG: SDR family oxidoreductase [Bdellovibrionales bacterium]|nr:SDR family oxidoreductase [Bdellovibrionales bacterium]